MTKLEAFIQTNQIRPAHLAREAGVSRKHLFWLRMGRAEPTRIMMIRVAAGCSHILQRNVYVPELFAIGD